MSKILKAIQEILLAIKESNRFNPWWYAGWTIVCLAGWWFVLRDLHGFFKYFTVSVLGLSWGFIATYMCGPYGPEYY